MESTRISWEEFKKRIADHIKQRKGPRMCRGQVDSNWALKTSFHRNTNGLTLPVYFQHLATLADQIGTIEGRRIDLRDRETMGSFLAYVQHHGYPTPLLDWTYSPYVAAYFAFSEINDREPQSDHVAIYVFDPSEWVGDWKQVYEYDDATPHVSILAPKSMGNRRQIVQQSYNYMFTNVADVEQHILALGQHGGKFYLEKYELPVQERTEVMVELETMGINAYSLFGTTEAICKRYREGVFRNDQIGKTPAQRMAELLNTLSERPSQKF